MSNPVLVQEFFSRLSSLYPTSIANQIIAIASLSPITLLNDITDFETAIDSGKATFNVTGNKSNFDPQKNTVTLPTASSTYWLMPGTDLVTFITRTTPANSSTISQTGLSLAGQIVGALAHELGHFEDKTQNTDLNRLSASIGIDEIFWAGVGLLSEGKATVNAVSVAEDVAANGGTADQLVNVALVTLADTDNSPYGQNNLKFAADNSDPKAANGIRPTLAMMN